MLDHKKLYFIVEEGQFNLGDFDKAKLMIELAAKTGASAIEFQLAYADDFYIGDEPGHKIYKEREFSDSQLKELVTTANAAGLDLIATCLSHKLVPKMAKFGCAGFNINASDINNPAIIDAVVAAGLPFFISLPLATTEEIDWALDRIAKLGRKSGFALLHGQHSMASGKEWVETEDTSLGVLRRLKEEYGCAIGFIDHSPSLFTPGVAVAAGATVISKHLTVSHLYKGPDHAICLDPQQMREAVEYAQKVFDSMQVTEKHLAKGEDMDRTVMRRSIVTARDIKKGDTITADDLAFKRPGTGISPSEAATLVGKMAKTDIAFDTVITNNQFE